MTTILVADDNERCVANLRQAFEREGYSVLTAGNGHEAIAHMEGGAVDVVFLDIVMPDKEGFETLLEIRRRFPGTPVYMMSGGGMRQNFDFLDLAMKLGATGALRKPLDMSKLIEIVKSLPLRA